MKKILLIIAAIFVVAFYLTNTATSAQAGGDKVRGEKSEGPSHQLGECPFKG